MYGLVSIGEVHWSFGAGMFEVPGDLVFIFNSFHIPLMEGQWVPCFG